MRVKMLRSRVGANETFNGGQEYEISESRAVQWIGARFAVSVEATVEHAVIEPVAEVAVDEPVIELAIEMPVVETATKKYRRRK